MCSRLCPAYNETNVTALQRVTSLLFCTMTRGGLLLLFCNALVLLSNWCLFYNYARNIPGMFTKCFECKHFKHCAQCKLHVQRAKFKRSNIKLVILISESERKLIQMLCPPDPTHERCSAWTLTAQRFRRSHPGKRYKKDTEWHEILCDTTCSLSFKIFGRVSERENKKIWIMRTCVRKGNEMATRFTLHIL